MSAFTTCAPIPAAAPDPSRRINFTHGLVLGPRELTQESAYLANRAEELAREVLGYGTVTGLRITVEALADGPGLLVSSGLALSPAGRPIRVAMPQAVLLNEWLNANRTDLLSHLRPGVESPPGDTLSLFVVLAYRQCPTENEPAPGIPCRSDEPPQMYTRLADDFCLDLRPQPPDQREDEALRELVVWLRHVEIVEGGAGTTSCEELLRALRASVTFSSPPDHLLSSPPAALRVDAADAFACFRAALLVWVTELRPLWRAGASTPAPCASGAHDDVLIAELEVPVTVQHDGVWRVTDPARIALSEARRPFLVPARLLQELALRERPGGTAAGSVAAAGVIRGDPTNATHRRPLLNGLRVTGVADGEVIVSFDGYVSPAVTDTHQYVVKAISQTVGGIPVIVNVDGYMSDGIHLRVHDIRGVRISAAELAGMEIAIEVSRIP